MYRIFTRGGNDVAGEVMAPKGGSGGILLQDTLRFSRGGNDVACEVMAPKGGWRYSPPEVIKGWE